MCPHLSNNFTPVADNLPPAVVCSAESAAGGSDLPVPTQAEPDASDSYRKSNGEANDGVNVAPEAASHSAGNSFRSGGGVESRHRDASEMTGAGLHLLANENSCSHLSTPKQAGVAPGPLASFHIPHTCISCGQTLRAKQDASRVVVYCGYGPCKSKAASDGAFGRTVEEAVDELNARILEEED